VKVGAGVRQLINLVKTIILPVVLYGCENLPLALRDEHRLRMSENRVLRIFGPQGEGEEVVGGWRRLRNEKLKGRDHLEDLGVNGKMIIQWILGK
jgi:hypothetical protein